MTLVDWGSPRLRIIKSIFFLHMLATQGIEPICLAIEYLICENVCQLIADTQAELSSLDLNQKLSRLRRYDSLKFFNKKFPRSKQFVFNSVLNYRRVTHFHLFLLEKKNNILLRKIFVPSLLTNKKNCTTPLNMAITYESIMIRKNSSK